MVFIVLTEVAHSEQNAGSSPQKRANDPHLIRRILVSLSQWLEETFIYAQVAGPRNECTRIIEVNLLLCLKQNSGKWCTKILSLQSKFLVLNPSPPPDSNHSDDSSDYDQSPPYPPPHFLGDYKSRKRTKKHVGIRLHFFARSDQIALFARSDQIIV
jgi:hypothetical protein